jgi:DNA-binding PadR family transcriptional regulator
MEELTDLEAVALATLAQRQPCTAYVVRRCFRDSPSAYFSDSAGSVYPLLERLRARALVTARATRRGRRPARVFVPTASGLAALRAWLRVPDEPAELVTFDPLRTRLFHLALLPAAERRRWLDAAEAALQRHGAALRARAEHDRAADDPFLDLAHENALLTLAARLEWIRRARLRLDASAPSTRRPRTTADR